MPKKLNILKKFKIPSFHNSQQSSIGLDIGSSSIKLLELEVKGKERMLKQLSFAALTPGEDTASALKAFIESQKISGRSVNTSISGQSLIMRYLTLPRMALHELKSTMQFEAGQYIPLPLDEVILDCAIVKEKAEDNKMLVVLAAVKKIVIQERISLLEKAGLMVKLIDIDCFCLSNAFNHSYQWAPAPLGVPEAKTAKSKVIGLLNIGADFTNIVILDGGTLRFSRDIAFGRLEPSLNNSAGEIFVHDSGTLKLSGEFSLNNLAGEISSSIDYFENQSGKRLEQAYLSGEVGEVDDASGMANFLNHQLGIAVAHYDFFSALKQGPGINTQELKTKGNSFVIALGLVLRC